MNKRRGGIEEILPVLHVEHRKVQIRPPLVNARHIDDDSALAGKVTRWVVFKFSQLTGTSRSGFTCLHQRGQSKVAPRVRTSINRISDAKFSGHCFLFPPCAKAV